MLRGDGVLRRLVWRVICRVRRLCKCRGELELSDVLRRRRARFWIAAGVYWRERVRNRRGRMIPLRALWPIGVDLDELSYR